MNNRLPLISVLLSAYNSESTIDRAIESIINQSYKNIELLIIDDYSSDSTYEKCDYYKNKYSNVSIYKNEKNLGLTASLNKLLNLSNGKYIARQDADDYSSSNRLKFQINFLHMNKLDACTSRSIIQSSNKLIPGLSYYLPINFLIKYKNPFIHGSLLIKKKTLINLGGYDENFKFAQDYKLMSDLIKNNYKVKIYKEPLYHLNMENNISVNYKKEQEYYAMCVRKNIIPSRKS